MLDKTESIRALAEKYTAAWCSQNPASVAAFYEENGSLTGSYRKSVGKFSLKLFATIRALRIYSSEWACK
jgi:hypothetical protein